jgi:hypothetical protein
MAATIGAVIAGCIIHKNAPEGGFSYARQCAGLEPQPHPSCYHPGLPPVTDPRFARALDPALEPSPKIRAVVDEHIEALRCCYDRVQPRVEGRVAVVWTIGASGHVSDYWTIASAVDDQRLLDCLGNLICGWRFPPAEQQFVSWRFLMKN